MPDVQHSKRYLIDITIFNSDTEVRYLVRDFKIKFTGGARPVHQKGRKIASAMKGQPIVTVQTRLFMRDADFSVVVTNSILNNLALIVRIGRLITFEQTSLFDIPNDDELSSTIFEMIGFIQDAEIIAEVGEFIIVDLTFLADDIAEFDIDDLEKFRA